MSPAAASTLSVLARVEMGRCARHPLFLTGIVVTTLFCFVDPDPQLGVLFHAIVPATAIGVLGIFVLASLTRRSQTIHAAAGAVPVAERTRSLALVAACLVPFAAGLAWWAWAFITYRNHAAPPNGFPFGPVGDGWAAAVLFGEGPLACLGGPLLGILVGRWSGARAAPALTAVGVIATCLVMQGLFEPLRRIRVVMPWTYFGGPAGIPGDPNRILLYSGSPAWWCVYVACLCALAVLAIVLHDRESPRRPVLMLAAGVGAAAAVAVGLAMWTGVDHTLVNPLPSS